MLISAISAFNTTPDGTARDPHTHAHTREAHTCLMCVCEREGESSCRRSRWALTEIIGVFIPLCHPFLFFFFTFITSIFHQRLHESVFSVFLLYPQVFRQESLTPAPPVCLPEWNKEIIEIVMMLEEGFFFFLKVPRSLDFILDFLENHFSV